ncbi:MAG: VOC family protein [Methylocystis sp.]|nr:VOC family protein [Methylocystis sp.]
MEQRLTVITLGVNDIDVARDFYSNTLGWTPESDLGKIVFYDLGGYLPALYSHEGLAKDITAPFERKLPAYHGFTLAYCTNSRAEVDDLFVKLREKGGIILKKPQEVFWGGYSGYFQDPDGHAWEVAHNPSWRINRDGRFERIATSD